MNYKGTTMLGGKICLPYVVLQTFPEGLGTEQVEVVHGEPFKLEKKLARYKARIMGKKLAEAEAKGTVLRNDTTARLKAYFPDEDRQSLKLVLQRGEYLDHEASNKALDRRPREFGGRRIRECYDVHPKELDDYFANPIGVNSVFFTVDDPPCAVLTERSKKLHQYPGLFGIPGGFMNPDMDRTPFDTTARDAAFQEVGRPLTEAKLVEVGRALDDLHIEIGMVGSIDGTSRQVTEAIRRADWEHRRIFTVDFDPRTCATYMKIMIEEIPQNVPKGGWIIGKSPFWVPAHYRLLYLALANKYGHDEVDIELENALS